MLVELKHKFQDLNNCVFVDFTGLNGRKAADLRRQIRIACGQTASLSVVKTTLVRRALNELGKDDASVTRFLTGPTGIAYGADDPVVLAKTLADWAKKEQVLHFKGGFLEGRPMAAETVGDLAKIPPKNVLMAQVVGTIAAPLQGLLAIAQGPVRKLLGLAEALAKKKAESGSAG